MHDDDDDLRATELSDAESFSFLFCSLWDASSDVRRCVVNIPDTIMYKDGTPHRWLFTSEQSGEVLKRKGDRLVPSEIVKSFKAKTRSLRGFKEVASRSMIATVWYMTSKTGMASYLVDEVQLMSLLLEKSVLEVLAIQVFMGGWPVKASGIFEHRYWLRKNSSTASETFELASVAHGQGISTFTHNLDRLLIGESQHEACAAYARRVVRRLELVARAKVANVVVQIAFNSSNFPFLVAVRAVYLWYPPIYFLENRLRFCYLAGCCPEVSSTSRSAILPPAEAPRRMSVAFDMSGGGGGGGRIWPAASNDGGLAISLSGVAFENNAAPSAGIDGYEDGCGSADDEEQAEARHLAAQAVAQVQTPALDVANLRASVDSEDPISPLYAPAPNRGPASNVQYRDADLPFRSAKLELGRLNGAGRRPLSASATGVYFPATGGAQTVHEAATLTAAVGKSRRSSNLGAAADEEKNGRSALELVRRPAPAAGERRHCEQMTESFKTRLHYYQSQLKDAETLPIEKFLKMRHSISAPHGRNKRDATVSARGINIPLGGHGVTKGGRRSTGFERKLPTQSGTVCFGDYCLLSYEQTHPHVERHGHDFCAQAKALHTHSHEAALDQLSIHREDPQIGLHHKDGKEEAPTMSLPLVKSAEAADAPPEVSRRAEILPHQLPFRSVLLARSEEGYNGSKLWEDNPLDLEVGELEPAAISGGSEGLTQLAKRHLQRVGKACLGVVRRSVHHSDTEPYQAAWDALNKEYRNQIYADALSKVHPSRFYFTVPLCDQCWKIYSLLDYYRERIVFGALQAELDHNARKRSAASRRRRPQSSPAVRGSEESFDRRMGAAAEGSSQDAGESQVNYENETWGEEEKVDLMRGASFEGGGVSVGISLSGGAVSSWVRMLSGSGGNQSELEGQGRGGHQQGYVGSGLPPRPHTSGRSRSDAEERMGQGHAETKESRSNSPGPRVPQQFVGRLGMGVAPMQQTRPQAAPLGNMLSSSAGNASGGRNAERGKRDHALPGRPKSAVAVSSRGTGGIFGIFRGSAPVAAPSSPSPKSAPLHEDSSSSFVSFLEHPGVVSTSRGESFPALFPGPGPSPMPIFPIASVQDITKSSPSFASMQDITKSSPSFASVQDITKSLDLLDAGQFVYSSLPYPGAPYFPLPTSLSDGAASIEFFEFDSTMLYDSQGLDDEDDSLYGPVTQHPRAAYESASRGQNRDRQKPLNDSKSAPHLGYLGGLDLQKKAQGFANTYGRKIHGAGKQKQKK